MSETGPEQAAPQRKSRPAVAGLVALAVFRNADTREVRTSVLESGIG